MEFSGVCWFDGLELSLVLVVFLKWMFRFFFLALSIFSVYVSCYSFGDALWYFSRVLGGLS